MFMDIIKKWAFIIFILILACIPINSYLQITTNIEQESFLYPAILSVVLIGLAIILSFQILKNSNHVVPIINWLGIFVIVVYSLLIYIIGFLLATFIFIASSLYILGEKKWKKITIINIFITSIIFVVFNYIFNVPIPRGILW